MRALVLSSLLLLAAPAAAQSPSAPAVQLPFLGVEATAEVRVAPDRATVRFGVQHQEKEAGDAQQRVNQTMQKIMAALRKAGVPGERIATERLQLYPVYDHTRQPDQEWQGPRLVGFQASNVVRVELPVDAGKGDRVGKVIDAALGAGANTIEGIQFDLVDEQPAYLQALRLASERAAHKADALAASLGVGRGRLLEAREAGVTFEPPVPFVAMDRAALKASAETAVSPGEMTVRATVAVRYEVTARQ